ncbi:hypothetical protein PIB30_095586 [Stylosanthes scabra]|uniref:Uncharacterized protein n=1 Tax=Stylosanthes scabra TaxID=79078 RepID=A0ABU6ZV31_9FABA|nr:hypothetical protein [Stylosanthes scabra]
MIGATPRLDQGMPRCGSAQDSICICANIHTYAWDSSTELLPNFGVIKKIIPEVAFNLNEDEYPQIKEQIALRGWRRLAAPMTGVSKLLVQEFYANAAVSDEEVANAGKLPYKSFLRGVVVDFSTENIRRVMRFKAET